MPGRSLGVWIVSSSGNGFGSPSAKVQNVFIPNGGIQAATAGQGYMRLWDAVTGKLLGRRSGITENFVRIGHSLFALLAGWLGGQLSRRVCRASREPDVSTLVNAELSNS